MSISSNLRRQFKSQAHALKPIVIVGAAGITAAVLKETDRALNDHELIKVKIASQDREARKAMAIEICTALNANLIQQIGQIIVIYRENQKED